MKEDEAFIRAIVDNPGDDTVRLVYADWLDDHDNPRSPYLRMEHEWAATHDPSERETLRQMAKSLDPVWVARVSRPPVGVCCDHFDLVELGPVITTSEIEDAQRHIGVTFPAEYRAFLLNYNGGWVDAPLFKDRNNQWMDQVGWALDPLPRVSRYTLRSHDLLPDDDGWIDNLWPRLPESVENWLSRFVPIGFDPDRIRTVFLSMSDSDCGHVRVIKTVCEFELELRQAAHEPVWATSFAAFLGSLPGSRPQHQL